MPAGGLWQERARGLFILCRCGRRHEALKHQADSEPKRRKVKADDIVHTKAAAAVVPGAELKFGEQLAGQIFHGIDQAHVGGAPKPYRAVFQ